jgi:hypothetical protein
MKWENLGNKRNAFGGVWLGYLSERDYLEDLDTDGKIILQLILNK